MKRLIYALLIAVGITACANDKDTPQPAKMPNTDSIRRADSLRKDSIMRDSILAYSCRSDIADKGLGYFAVTGCSKRCDINVMNGEQWKGMKTVDYAVLTAYVNPAGQRQKAYWKECDKRTFDVVYYHITHNMLTCQYWFN